MVFGYGVGGQFFFISLHFSVARNPVEVELLKAVLGVGTCMRGGIR